MPDEDREHTPMIDGGDDEDFVFDIVEGEEPVGLDEPAEELETQVSAAPEPAAEPAPPAEEQPRDEKGRFVKADAEPAESPEAQPAPTEPAAPEAQPEAEPEQVEQFPTFRYRAGGIEYELEGSEVGQDGLFVPVDRLADLGQRLSLAQHARQSIADLQRKLTRVQQGSEQRVVQAEKTLEAIENLMQQGPEAVGRWLDELDRNWPLMKKEAELQALRAQQEAERERVSEADEERESQKLAPILADAIDYYTTEYGSQSAYAGINKAQMYDRLSGPLFDRVFVQGKEEEIASTLPHAVVVYELANGNVVAIDPQAIEQEYRFVAQLTGRKAEVDEAARANKAATAQTEAPPTVAASGAPAASPEKEVPEFESPEQIDEWIDSGDWQKSFD